MADLKLKPITIFSLLLIMILSIVLTYYPHINYTFLLHVDEWYHIAVAQKIATSVSIPASSVYLKGIPFVDPEVGYHVLLAVIYWALHPSATQWIYLPVILEAIAVLSVFFFVYKFLGEREALVASLLVALLPTNVTIGGPVFLIPENLGLIFIPIALVFAFRLTKIKPIYNYIGLFAVAVFLLYSHPPTALVLLIILFFYCLFLFVSKVNKDRKLALQLFLVVLLAVIVAIPNYIAYLSNRGVGGVVFGLPVTVGPVFVVYGVLQTLFFLGGIYLFVREKEISKEVLSLLVTVIVLLMFIFLFIYFNINYLLPYQRTFMPLFLIMSIFASYGYVSLLRLNKKRGIQIGSILFAIALVATIYFSVHLDLTTPYYHLITSQDYSNFLYIKSHYAPNSIAILSNPFTARAFTPITGMYVYSVEPFGPSASYSILLNNTNSFFAGNCSDSAFLRDNNISIVYTNTTCINSNLTLVHNETYILK